MANVIDKQTDQHNFEVLRVRGHISVTLILLETAPDTFAVNYEASYSGMKDGHLSGGPFPVNGNGTHVVNQNPKVTVTLSNWSDDKANHLISAHCKISVDVPVLGNTTVFDKTIGGKYGVWEK